MSTPKYARRRVNIDPRLPLPPGVIDVGIDDSKDLTISAADVANNGYTGGVSRDDRPTNPNGPILTPADQKPVTSGSNPWGIARLVKQELVINSDGNLMVEVTWEMPTWPGDYEERLNII